MAQKYNPRIKLFHTVFRLVAVVTTMIAANALAQVANAAQRSTFNPTSPNASSNVLNTPVYVQTFYDHGGRFPESLGLADLNGDGKLDVLVANTGSNTISVLLGNGHGWFGLPNTYGSGAAGPVAVDLADLNGDGIPDVVAPNWGGVGILLGNGDGTFRPAITYGYSASSVVVTELNGDGKLDLALSTYRNIAILVGNGDGTFQAALTYGWGTGDGVGWTRSLAAGDVNGDGKPDLMVATGSSNYPYGPGTVAVLLGNGDGTFQTAMTYDSGGMYAFSLSAADVSGDGKLDLIVSNTCIASLCGTVAVMLGNGNGSFQTPTLYNPGGLVPRSAVIKDVNGDGKPDLVVANECADYSCKNIGSVGVLLGNGDGTFLSPVPYNVGGLPFDAAVGDVDSDGKPDVLVAPTTDRIYVFLTKTGAVTKTLVTTSGSPTSVGQPVTFTATVTSSQGTIPAGEVMAFYDGIKMLGSASLVNGTAVYTTSSLSGKNHNIRATYVGNDIFRLSNGNVQQIVNLYTTTTTLTTSPNPSNYGGPVILTAHVTVTTSTAPTSTVAFKMGTTELGRVSVNASGVATLTKMKLPPGSYPLTATYNSDAVNGKSTSSAVIQTVNPAQITMVLKSSSNPAKQGQSVRFTATLTSNGGVPVGQTVTFSYNGSPLGTGTLGSLGNARLSSTALPVGTGVVTATYAGDGNYSSATASLTQTVN